MAIEHEVWSDEAIPPGETLAETLDALGMSQAELARRANRPQQVINEIIQGKKEITPETAIEFERVLGVPAHIWTGLEATYRMARARIAEAERLTKEEPTASAFPYREMVKEGWVPDTRDKRARTEVLLRFFAVATLDCVDTYGAAWRRSPLKNVSEHALAAWLRRGEIEARNITCGAFDEEAVRKVVEAVPSYTRQDDTVFRVLVNSLAAAGVALVFVQHLPRTGAQGATRWIGQRAVVQLSCRYRWADILWFTLLHELAHILKHGRREMFVDLEHRNQDRTKDPREAEADRFAAAHLIPEASYRRFTVRARWSVGDVRAFADEVGVHPGVVVGRLQHDKHIGPELLNRLRTQYVLRPEMQTSS